MCSLGSGGSPVRVSGRSSWVQDDHPRLIRDYSAARSDCPIATPWGQRLTLPQMNPAAILHLGGRSTTTRVHDGPIQVPSTAPVRRDRGTRAVEADRHLCHGPFQSRRRRPTHLPRGAVRAHRRSVGSAANRGCGFAVRGNSAAPRSSGGSEIPRSNRIRSFDGAWLTANHEYFWPPKKLTPGSPLVRSGSAE